MRRFITGVGSLLVLAVLLVGIPVVLILLAGNPIPSWSELQQVATYPDFGGRFTIGTVLPIIGWFAWAWFAAGFLIQLPVQLREIPAPHVPGLGLSQAGAGVLIAAVLVMITGVSVVSTASPAHAADIHEAPASSISQLVDAPSVVSQPGAVQQSAPAETPTPTPKAAAPTYTVQDGDSLWEIAEKTLGSGQRWPEIAQLNYGVQQADGYSLTTQNWLNAGWVLTLPADATTTTTTAGAGETQHVVQPGDTLWGIAQAELGDGALYPEIVHATEGVIQSDGATLTDPDLIQPGWVVDVPTTASAPAVEPNAPAVASSSTTAPSTSSSTSSPTQRDQVPSAPASSTAESPSVGASESATSTPHDAQSESSTDSSRVAPAHVETTSAQQDEDDSWIDEIFNVRTLGGIGALLAAGLLGVLAIRRRKQNRQRRPGQQISMPTPEASTIELELRAVENPMGMDDVDHALRYLAVWAQDGGHALPPLYALRLADTEISLYLDEPTELPAPFTAVTDDNVVWIVDPEQLPELERIPSPPYPALVTIGQDATDAHLMVDLEHIGALNLAGDATAADGALTALALELATSRWAEDLQITLVGVAEGLPDALDTGRIRHVDDTQTLLRNLRGQADAAETALASLGADSIEHARTLGVDAESWTPEIVILGNMPEPEIREQLAELVTRLPRVGIAAVANGHLAGDWTFRVLSGEEAELEIPASTAGLPLHPQIVTEDEYARILTLFQVADEDAVDAPDWSATLDASEIPLDDLPPAQEPVAEEETTSAHTEISEQATAISDDDDDDSWKGDLRRLLPPPSLVDEGSSADAVELPGPAEVPDQAAQSAQPAPITTTGPAEPDDFVWAQLARLRQGPWIRLLGPVGLQNARGVEPRTPNSSAVNRSAVNRATELIAFLTLNPGADYKQVHEALWRGRSPEGKQAASNRNGLTTRARKWLGNDDDGCPYFPPVGTDGYRLDGVPSDWDIWLALVGDDPSATPTRNLVAALELVEGQPFSAVKDKYYVWSEKLKQRMIEKIGDAAHELCNRSLKLGDITHARLAAAVGREVSPVNEIFWRDALRAEHQARDTAGFDRVVAQLEDTLDLLEDGYEPEPETQALIDQIRGRHAIAS
jgi:nucleoid-associated protein YgaU